MDTLCIKDNIGQEIAYALWGDISKTKVSKFYDRNGFYVFSRPMHNSSAYFSYFKADGGKASEITVQCPALVTYLIPPENIFSELMLSPRLKYENKKLIRVDNWRDMYGTFYCGPDTFDKYDYIKGKNNCSKELRQIIRHLTTYGESNTVYSMYKIMKYTNPKGKLTHFSVEFQTDITKKHNKVWSEKSSKYTTKIPFYLSAIRMKTSFCAFNTNRLALAIENAKRAKVP